MKRFLKLISIPAFMALLLTSCGQSGPDTSWIKPQYDGHYYDGVDTTLTGLKLQKEIHKHMLRTHDYYVNYADVNAYIAGTATYTKGGKTYTVDMGIDSTKSLWAQGKYESFYTGKNYKTTSSWTREHVWPASKSADLWTHEILDADEAGYVGGGSDLYHIRPVEYEVNEKRSNSRFYTFASDDTYTVYPNQKYTQTPRYLKISGSKCEVDDSLKGDVARLGMYVYIHYKQFNTGVEPLNSNVLLGNLRFQDYMYVGADQTEDDAIARLLEWHKIDPVSELELTRNDVIEKVQGNRNPFVDHPEWALECFE